MVRLGLALLAIAVVALGVVYGAGSGWFGSQDGPGTIVGAAVPAEVVAARAAAVERAADGVGVPRPKQILFGDFHVHTTISFDAFLTSLPSMGGEGAHPPADACDFARYCSALDFWSINDHAEGISPQAWSETVASIRQCNELAGDDGNPDLVSFLGWEWTQVGISPDDHYGHKNVVLPGLADDEIPARPIAAGGQTLAVQESPPGVIPRGLMALAGGDSRLHTLAGYFAEREKTPRCDADANTRDLPADCLEVAETPADLFRKLDEWGLDSIVIPHGTTWGFYTPPGSTWAKQLAGDMHDEDRQTLLEVYSGHGDSEPYREWRAVRFDDDGNPYCPEPSEAYLPSCWRAGEIIEERCLDEGESEAICTARAAETRRLAAAAGAAGHLVVMGEDAAEWLDAGQCRDCDQPAFNYRPGGSAQYLLALGNFDEDPGNPRRFRMGFMSSSDNHYARPGTGYKELFRRGNTESSAIGGNSESPLRDFLRAPAEEPSAEPRDFDPANSDMMGFQLLEGERQASYFMTGGLIATHANGRDRASIWDAVKRREVYGTSGPRILLWFDLLNPPGSRGGALPMGGEAAMDDAPIFQARAVGSFEQLPGCPDVTLGALPPDSIERLCKGECYHPSDQRRPITRIEVVRVRPQTRPDEDMSYLIDDPWKTFPCDESPDGCVVTFTDPEFAGQHRDTVYYVRAYEPPAPAINGAGVNCTFDDDGRCVEANLCSGSGDCLAEHEPRAWSSPIFVDYASPEVDDAETALAQHSGAMR